MTTRTTFPQNLQPLRELMPTLLAHLESGHEQDWYAFVWLEQTNRLGFTAARSENTDLSSDRGMVFRIMANGVHYERSTNQLDAAHLQTLAKAFRADVEQQAGVITTPAYRPTTWADECAAGMGAETLVQLPEDLTAATEVTFGVRCTQLPEATSMKGLSTLARDLRTSLQQRASEYIAAHADAGLQPFADIMVMARQQVTVNVFVDREKNIAQVLPTTLFYAMAATATGHTSREVMGGMGGLEIAALSEQQQQDLIELGFKLNQAQKLVPGRYPVITGPDVTGVIAHEAFGHTQEGDTWMKGRSIAKDLREQQIRVGNDQASIVNQADVFAMGDDTHGTNGSYFFDHEGALARPQVILDRGHLSAPMTDLASALHFNAPRTGNGKRESWRRPLMTRQTNTYFTPGDQSVDSLIGMVDYGFLAMQAHGGMEDPKGGSLTAGTSYLEEIKDGKLTGRLFLGPAGGHVELSDPVFDLLDKIVAKSSTNNPDGIPENKYGGCGKYHKEVVSAGCGGPFILWENVNCG